jgi:hypothetical protein
MHALLIGGAVTIVASFGAAWLGARLQKKWTPNPNPSIEALGSRIEEVRDRIEAIEQERIESEHFTLTMQLQQGVRGNYILEVRNDTDKDVTVETVQFFRGEAPLSGRCKPKPTDDWRMPAQKGKQLWLSPQPDPASTLRFSGIEPHTPAIALRVVLMCRSNGKLRTAEQTLVVTVDYSNQTLTQWGP